MIRIILICILANISIGLFAQKNEKIRVDNQTLYLKSQKKLGTSNAEYCVACEDAKLQKKCKSIIKMGVNNYSQTSLSEAELSLIAKSKSIQTLEGLKYEKLSEDLSIPYIQKGAHRVYFIGSGKNLIIDEYQEPEEQPIIVGRKRPQVPQRVLQCQDDCHTIFSNCAKNCLSVPGGGAVSQDDITRCYNGCIRSSLSCVKGCNALTAISHIELLNFVEIPVIKINN